MFVFFNLAGNARVGLTSVVVVWGVVVWDFWLGVLLAVVALTCGH